MSYWNHRVLVHKDYAEIIECSYDDSDQIWGWCKASPVGNDPKDLKGELENQLQAFKAPVIKFKDLPKIVVGQSPLRPRLKFTPRSTKKEK